MPSAASFKADPNNLEECRYMAIIDVKTEITGNVWKIVASIGDELPEDEPILILESMKMEIPVGATEDGVLKEILVAEGDTVTEGTVVARIEVA
jgi:acetyl-CoA carboxylase biotin carboxyl carrier protein